MRTTIRALIVSICAAIGSVTSATAAPDWEVERNFRFFRYLSDVAVQRVAYDIAAARLRKTPQPEDVELVLNHPLYWSETKLSEAGQARDLWPDAWKDPALVTPYDLLKRLRAREKGRNHLYTAEEVGRRGWGSLLVRSATHATRHGGTDTCWDPDTRRHSGCDDLGDYARPAGWIVRIYDLSAPDAKDCGWSATAGAFVGARDEAGLYVSQRNPTSASWSEQGLSCREIRVYVPSDTADSQKVAGRLELKRVDRNGAVTPVQVAPSDYLVVGFADSFGSGEGNPERAAYFAASPPAVDNTFLPARNPDSFASQRAQWTDRWCHRSVYSWQIRTGIQLAMADRKRSVTILPYGCSGAEVFSGLLYTYPGVEQENVSTSRPSGHSAQIALAYQELCRRYYPKGGQPAVQEEPEWQNDDALKRAASSGGVLDLGDARRKEVLDYVAANVARCDASGPSQKTFKRSVNLLLMIAGINDIGFSRWVTAAIADKGVSDLTGGFIPKLSDSQTKLRLDRLRFRYDILREALDKHFLIDAGLKPQGAPVGATLDRVIMPLYPRALDDENGNRCVSGNRGMTSGTFPSGNDMSGSCERKGLAFNIGKLLSLANVRGPVLAIRKREHMDAIEEFRKNQLDAGVVRFAAASPTRPGYSVVTAPNDDHGVFAKRGFCATQDALGTNPGDGTCLSFGRIKAALKPACWKWGNQFGPIAKCILESAESQFVPRENPSWLGEWRPSAPDGVSRDNKFYPYAHRTRLFRTPDDVYVIINNRPTIFTDATPPGILDLAGRATSGAFHPSAEGHSIIAGMVAEHAPKNVETKP